MAQQHSLTCLSTFKIDNYAHMIKFSPDGLCIATRNNNKNKNKVTLRNATGTYICTFKVDGMVSSIDFNLSGDLIAIGTVHGTIKILSVSSHECLLTLSGHSGKVTSVAFSPRDTIASASEDMTIRIWEATTGTCLHVLQEHTCKVTSVAYSPDGKRIVSGSSDWTANLWDVATGNCFVTFMVRSNRFVAAFSPDGNVITVVSKYNIKLLNVRTGEVLLQRNFGLFRNLTLVSNHSRLLIAGTNGQIIRVWDVVTDTCVAELNGHKDNICSVVSSPGGNKLVVASVSGTATLWDLSELLLEARVLTLVLGRRRRGLPHIPQELWQLILEEFC